MSINDVYLDDEKKETISMVADLLSHYIDEQTFRVASVHGYSSRYRECMKEAKNEFLNNIYPKILDYVHYFNEYQNIFLCYPNWCSTMPMAMFNFLKCHNTKGKTIIPVCIHNGEGDGESVADINKLCPKANVFPPLEIKSNKIDKFELRKEIEFLKNKLE